MAFTFAGYEAASRPTDNASPGARALMAYCLRRWGFATNLGIYAPRNVRGGSSLSHHAEGRALDIGIPVITPTRADAVKGMQIVDALGPPGRRLGVDHLIYNRTIWSARAPGGRAYTGVAPHYDHIHLGLTRKSGANLTLATVAAVVGSLGDTTDGPEPAELSGITHRVTASSLRLRLRPSTSGSLVGGLPRGAGVAAEPDPPVDRDGHQWVRVRALVEGRPEKGWVASEYLEPVSPEPTEPEPAGPTLEGATHRVTASSLRLRPQPTTAADPITSLPNGTTVQQLPDPARHADGHEWVRVWALVDGRPQEGWVASEHLEHLG